jgi:Fe2+ or Zn2+ uptake regulation protein
MDAPGTDPSLSEQELARSLRAAGLKATRPRLVVLRLLRERRHLSADELFAELQARRTPLTRASVYNSLAALLAHRLVMLTDAGPGRALYEAADRWHHHFVCRKCGAIQDVACVVGERPCLNPSEVDGEIDEAQVIFRGLCAQCAKRRKRPSTGKRPSIAGKKEKQ